jgi:hypothetical protein
MKGKKAEENGIATQEQLVEVPRTEAAREADRYAEIQIDIETKKHLLELSSTSCHRSMQRDVA